MLKDTRMTSFLILHQMANENGVTQEMLWAVVLGYHIYSLVTSTWWNVPRLPPTRASIYEPFLHLTWDVHFVSWTVESPSERLHKLQPKHHTLCMHIPKQILKHFYRTLLRPNTIDSQITSNRCNHIWLWHHSLNGDTLHLQNGGRPSDEPQ